MVLVDAVIEPCRPAAHALQSTTEHRQWQNGTFQQDTLKLVPTQIQTRKNSPPHTARRRLRVVSRCWRRTSQPHSVLRSSSWNPLDSKTQVHRHQNTKTCPTLAEHHIYQPGTPQLAQLRTLRGNNIRLHTARNRTMLRGPDWGRTDHQDMGSALQTLSMRAIVPRRALATARSTSESSGITVSPSGANRLRR